MQVIIGCKCPSLDLMEYIQVFQPVAFAFFYLLFCRQLVMFVFVCLYNSRHGDGGMGGKTCDALTGKQEA